MLGDFVINDGVLEKYNGTEEYVSIPDGVTEIGDSAFFFCNRLRSVTIPSSVTIIGAHAFHHCKGLTSVTIHRGVTVIGEGAFWGCDDLTSVKIPDSMTVLEDLAFAQCKCLNTVIIPDSVTKIGILVFSGCSEITVVCREGSYAHRYCEEKNLTFLFDYQYEAFRGVLPPGIEKLSSPFLADEEKPFLFISYSHKDRDAVLKTIKDLYESGWRIWYDEGLTIGDSYDQTLEEHVKNCSAFLLFVTEHSAESSYIREHEIPWAQAFGKPIVKCILDEETDCEVDPDSVIAVVSPSEIEPALEKIEGLTKTCRREAKGISVVVNPADRNGGANGYGFAYCLYADPSAAKAKAILLEAKNGGCNLYDAVENGEDKEKLRESASLIVFMDRAFLSDEHLAGILAEAFSAGRDIAVCQMEDIEDGDLPENLKALYKMQWLSFVHGITKDMNTRLARHLQKRGCRNTAVLPGFDYVTTDAGIVITRYTGKEPELRIEREYGGVPGVKIADNAVENRIHRKTVMIPDTVTEIGKEAFDGCTGLSSVILSYGLQKMKTNAFSDCTSLVSVGIPNSVTEIGDRAFSGCENLTSVKLPESVTSIGDAAFRGCRGLADSNGFVIIRGVLYSYYGTDTIVNIPNGVTTISSSSFSFISLKSVVIPDGVTVIGDSAFYGCGNLTLVKLPESVTSIGDAAFRGCRGLADSNGFVIIRGVLYSYHGNETAITIPQTVKRVSDGAFSFNEELTSVTIPNSVTEIGDSAFSNCTRLRSVIIPESVTEIKKYAFMSCRNLTTVTVPESVTQIDAHVFYGCENLTLCGKPGSCAEAFAKEQHIPFREA